MGGIYAKCSECHGVGSVDVPEVVVSVVLEEAPIESVIEDTANDKDGVVVSINSDKLYDKLSKTKKISQGSMVKKPVRTKTKKA